MTVNKITEKVKLRDIQIPEDYEQLSNLFNLIEPGSTTTQSLEEEDRHIPSQSNLKYDELGRLVGFGRIRVIAETSDGQLIGYGSSWRAPWVEPGNLASVFCVHPDFRGQGVGELILSHIEKWANEHKATLLFSELKDWITDSLPFVQKRGFSLEAHVFELILDLQHFESIRLADSIEQVKQSGIQFITLADLPSEESEQKLYQLSVETSKDNPGQSGNLPPFSQWQKEFFPKDYSRPEWVFIAVDGDQFVGVTTLFNMEDPGVIYTNYTGVQKEYRGRGIAKALKLISIDAALEAGAHTMTTDSEESNAPMQHLNRSLGYQPGKGHYRILKEL